MKKLLILFVFGIFFILFLSFFSSTIKAQNTSCADDVLKENDQNKFLIDANACLGNLRAAFNQSKAATAPLETQLNGIKDRVAFIEADLVRKKNEIDNGYKNLEEKKIIFDKTVARNYIESYNSNWLSYFLSGSQASEIIQNLAYQKAKADQDKQIITNIALSITDLEEKRINLQSEETKLAAIKISLDKVVTEAKAYQATLSTKIAQLSAQQQQILSQRLAALNIPRSAGASALYCTDDRKIDIGFNAFAFFSYGIPHYVGMNQYGAYGRAKNAGQDYKTILNAYFQNISIECRDTPGSIDVQGYGSMNFEDYIKGVVNKEMGADIQEALKAQAVAARSFAMNESKPICTSQSCQVYSNDRRDAANNAVDATGANACGQGKAEFVVSDGNIAKTWFASTFGGYAHTSAEIWGGNTSYTKNFADTKTTSVSSFDDLKANAYDNESACFYTAQGWRKGEYKNSAWLKPEEVADIANVILLVRKDSSKKCFVYQPDKSPPPPDPNKGCSTTDNWSADRVRQELGGEAISTATSVEVTGVDWTSGKTTQIKINGISFDGNEFKNYFNLRAPANIQIVGPLYNVERQ